MITGTVTGREIKKNRDGDKNVLLLQCSMQENDDVQSIEWNGQPGEMSNPINGSEIIIDDVGESYKIGIACDDGIEPTTDVGEKKYYSLDSGGAISAFINLLNTGIIELNGNGGNAVKYAELNTGLQNLVTQMQAELVKIAAGIASAGGAYTPGTLSVDISASEAAEVKLK